MRGAVQTSRFIDLLALLLVGAIAIFAGLGRGTFWEPDEPRFAEATRQMFLRDDFVTPYLNGVPRFEKPILFYWTQAATYSVFGANELAARLPSALAGLGVILVLYLIGVEVASRRAALVSALVMATMYRFVTYARIGLTDVPVMFFITAAVYGFLLAVRRSSAAWAYFAWACVGLAMLTKGPVGIVPVAIWATYATFSRDWSLVTRVKPIVGTILAVVIALPWYVLMVLQHGRAFTDLAFGYEILARVLSEESFERPHGFFYYFKVWPGDAAPWSALFVAGIGWMAWRWRRLQPATRQAVVFATAWFISVFLGFSLSSSKVTHYVLPAYPAAALLIGIFVDRLADTREDAVWWRVPMALIGAVVIVAAVVSALFLEVLDPGDTLVQWLVPGALAAGAVVIAAATWKRRLVPAVYGLSVMLAALFALLGGLVVPRVVDPLKPLPLLARQAADLSAGDASIGLYGQYGSASVMYYSRRHVIRLEGDDATVRFLSADPARVCVMPMADFERLQPRLTGVTTLAEAEEFNVRFKWLLDRQRTRGRMWVLVGHPAVASTSHSQGTKS